MSTPNLQMKKLRRRMEDILPLQRLAVMTDEEVERELYKRTLRHLRGIQHLPMDFLREEATIVAMDL